MLEHISIMYLCALALFTWLTLCYWQMVEEYKWRDLHDYSVKMFSEKPGLGIGYVPPDHTKTPSQNSFVNYSYEMLVNFVVVFGVLITLSKFLELVETQIITFIQPDPLPEELIQQREYIKLELSRMHMTLDSDDQEQNLEETQTPIELYKQENDELRQQVNALEVRCLEMHQMLINLQPLNSVGDGNLNNTDSHLNISRSHPIVSQLSTENIRSYSSRGDQLNNGEGDASIMILKSPVTLSSSTSSLHEVSMPLSSQSSLSSLKMVSSSSLSRSGQSLPHTPSVPSLVTQNVFITNSHIHINGHVYVSDQTLNINVGSQSSFYTRTQSEFLQVWSKFITWPNDGPITSNMHSNNLLI